MIKWGLWIHYVTWSLATMFCCVVIVWKHNVFVVTITCDEGFIRYLESGMLLRSKDMSTIRDSVFRNKCMFPIYLQYIIVIYLLQVFLLYEYVLLASIFGILILVDLFLISCVCVWFGASSLDSFTRCFIDLYCILK